jgi:hypothetical protein
MTQRKSDAELVAEAKADEKKEEAAEERREERAEAKAAEKAPKVLDGMHALEALDAAAGAVLDAAAKCQGVRDLTRQAQRIISDDADRYERFASEAGRNALMQKAGALSKLAQALYGVSEEAEQLVLALRKTPASISFKPDSLPQ